MNRYVVLFNVYKDAYTPEPLRQMKEYLGYTIKDVLAVLERETADLYAVEITMVAKI